MKYTIHTADLEELLFEHSSLPIPDGKGFTEYHDKIDWGFVSGNFSSIETEDVFIQHFESVADRDIELYGKSDIELVEMHFHLKGAAKNKLANFNQEFFIGSGEHQMIYTPSTEGIVELFEGEMMDVFNIEFTPEHFLELTEGIEGPIQSFAEKVAEHDLAHTGQRALHTTPQMLVVIYDIINCQMPDNLKSAYMKNKATELLILLANQWQEELKHEVFTFSDTDREKLNSLKDFLMTCPYEIPCLKELALEYGLNEFKMKKGFKQLFNTTVYGYLLDIKLERAKNLLVKSSLTIGEIGSSIGYKYAQHFSTAFKRKYGYTPNALRKH